MKRILWQSPIWMVVITFIVLDLGEVYGQAGAGTISGLVLDASRSIIPQARVRLIRENTGDARQTISNGSGIFSFTALPVGSYTVEVESAGFNKLVQKNIAIHSGDNINLRNLVLEAATLSQSIQVTESDGNVIAVDTGEKASVVTARQVQELSIVGRSAVELLKILPGVVNQGGDTGEIVGFYPGDVGSYNIGGMRDDTIDLVSDGVNTLIPICKCGSVATPNVDQLQEFKVQTASFSAENASGPVVITTTSKSGTREFHGEAYLYARHHSLNSNDWQANRYDTPKPKDRFYFPGFNVGGPIVIPGTGFNKNRDKLFFFVGAEWMRQNVDLGVKPATVPTAKMRRGDFTELLNGLNLNGPDVQHVPSLDGINQTPVLDPMLLDKGGQVLVNLFPLPNRDPAANGGYNYVSSIINPQNRTQQLFRIDYVPSNVIKLYTKLNIENETTPHPYSLGGNGVPFPTSVIESNTSYSGAINLTQIISGMMTNELVFAMTSLYVNRRFEDPGKISRKSLGYPYRGIYKNDTDQIPDISGWGGGVPDIYAPGGFYPDFDQKDWLVSLTDNFVRVQGAQIQKFGFFFQKLAARQSIANPDNGSLVFTTWLGKSTGNSYADMLLGRPGAYFESTKNPLGDYYQNEISFYAQDNWKATPRLSIELGARFYHLGRVAEKQGYVAGFDSSRYVPVASIDAYTGIVARYLGGPVPISGYLTPKLRIGPRFGFAYNLSGKGDTVLRGGFGSFLYRDTPGFSNVGIGNPPLQLSTSLFNYQGSLSEIDHLNLAVTKPDISVLDIKDDRIPTTYSWNLTLAHRFPGSIVLETAYVGNSSQNQLTLLYNLNPVPEGAMVGFPRGSDPNDYRPYQNYGSINLSTHALTQNYNALQVSFNREGKYISAVGSYTFSKALGTGGYSYVVADSFDFRRRSYGVLAYDRTHIFNIGYILDLPSPARSHVLREVVNGWQISGITQIQSGAPFSNQLHVGGTMANGDFISPTNVVGTPDTLANAILTCDPRQGTGGNVLANVRCFTAPLPGINGPYQLPYLKSPYFQGHDLSLFKTFALDSQNDARKLQLRVSAFNFLNHPNRVILPNDPDVTLNFDQGVLDQQSLEKFGRTENKKGRRIIQLAIKFMF